MIRGRRIVQAPNGQLRGNFRGHYGANTLAGPWLDCTVQCFSQVTVHLLSSWSPNLVTVHVLVQEVAVFRSPYLCNGVREKCGMVSRRGLAGPRVSNLGFVMRRQRRSYLLIEPEPRREHASKQLVRLAVSSIPASLMLQQHRLQSTRIRFG